MKKKAAGLYFENFGPTRLIGAEYKLINYLSLEEYDKRYVDLSEIIKNIGKLCKQNSAKICTKRNNLVTQFHKEINTQRERMYISLGRYDKIEGTNKKREKRGLINIIGTSMNTLFGVCDDKCIKSTTKLIKSVEESGTNTLHIIKAQTTVVKSVINNIGLTINKTNEIYKEINDKIVNINSTLSKVLNKTDEIFEIFEMEEIQNLYTALINQFAYETSTLSQIVTAARGEVIHASLITPMEIAATLKEISHILKGKLNIPMGTQPSELYELKKLTELTVYYENGQIVFITKIPLVTDIELTLYNAIPVPITEIKENKTTKVIISSENPYLAITKDRRHFTTFTEVQ
jgi:hypothetical protein